MSRKILFITPQPFFIERGSPYRARAEVQAIVDNDYQVDLLSYDFGRKIKIDDVNFFRSYRPFWINKVGIGLSFNKLILDIFLFIKTIQLISKNKYAAIHGIEEAGVMAAFLFLFTRTPYIFDMHSHMSEQLSQCIIKPDGLIYKIIFGIEKFCIRNAAGVITVSDLITARVRGFSEKTPAITLEDLPLDNSFNTNNRDALDIKKSLNLSDTTNIVYTGNFEPYQGIDLLIDGFFEFQKINNHSNVKLIIVGGGEETDQKFIFYKTKSKQLGLENNIIFTGQKSEDEVSSYMQIADILISPRIAGAHTPLKIYSYLAAKKIIVATTITAHTNVLNNNNSFLANPDPKSLAKTLEDTIQASSSIKEEKISNGTFLLEKRFNKKEFSRRVGLIYKAVLGENISDEVLLSAQKLLSNSN